MTGLSRRQRDDVNAQRHAKPAWPTASWVGTAIALLDALEAAEAERDALGAKLRKQALGSLEQNTDMHEALDRAVAAEAERDRLARQVEAVRALLTHPSWPGDHVRADALRAALAEGSEQ